MAATGELDGLVHHVLLEHIVASGFAPSIDVLAAGAGCAPDEAVTSLRRLHEGHGLVLHPGGDPPEPWLVHPFALVPTAFWVEDHRRGWWAPCVWCALGVVALVEGPARIHARYGGEGVPATIACDGTDLSPADPVVHFPVPVARAWDNVHRFCGSTLVFPAAAAVDAWCERHGQPRGDVQPLATVAELARRWYGGHRARDWHKWTVEEAAAIFRGLGLQGPVWELPAAEGRF